MGQSKEEEVAADGQQQQKWRKLLWWVGVPACRQAGCGGETSDEEDRATPDASTCA